MIARALGVGLVVGALSSALPLEIFGLAVVGLAASVGIGVLRAQRARDAKLVAFPAIVAASAVLAITVAAFLPFKHEDRTRLELSPGCYTVAQLASRAGGQAEDVPDHARLRQVCFSEVRPTVRAVQAALATQAGVTMGFGYCGNGASFLFGATPIAPRFTAVR